MRIRILVPALLLLLVSGLALAGDPAHKATGADAKAHMEMMKAEMMKCAVCKNMAAHMDEYGATMKTEVIKTNNGMAMMHMVTDPKQVGRLVGDVMKTHKGQVEATDVKRIAEELLAGA